MKINDVNASAIAGTQAERTQGAQATPRSREAGAHGSGDQVQLSNLSSRLVEMLGSQEPGRSARLEKLSAQVKAGTYRAAPADVSRKLVDESMTLGG